MRIAFIGSSSPLFYDYRNKASRAPSDTESSPNPVLDSPFGLLLLFDEIWFLCRSLCPENMRNLPYVKFLDETGSLPKLDDIAFSDLKSAKIELPIYNKYLKHRERFFSRYRKIVRKVGIVWNSAPDNHTHSLKVGNTNISANSVALRNLLFDMEVVKRIGRKNVEFVVNSFFQTWMQDSENPVVKAKFTELLVLDYIPNYLTPKGPYNKCIEEVRRNPYLKDFRKWITEQSFGASQKELQTMKRRVESTIKEAQEEVFLKYLDPRTQYISIGKTVLGEVIDVAIPGSSLLMDAAEAISDFFDKKQRRWQGFIVLLRHMKRRANASSSL